ncbi:hypothetical protein PVAP13_8KG309200 [Panicum virgatum]|uniref:Uncharacterized protein n=1 Tax=Panicum virgatum TaxID=38727 RepID=A0A8T0PPN8_PANVG|nr:hypothetical protein PVAP13_8KG309200 [Panicum virgatum]
MQVTDSIKQIHEVLGHSCGTMCLCRQLCVDVRAQKQPAQAQEQQPVQQPTAPAWITYQRQGRRTSG